MSRQDQKKNQASPLLFQKRVSVTDSIAAQYIGTDMEMDPKEGYIKPVPPPPQPLIR